MTSLFVSYSRKDAGIARKITEAFKGYGLDFWVDWKGIPATVDWWKEIEKGIEEADNFIFLLSPDSARSKVCRREIRHAARNGKRLIPVVVRDITADECPKELRRLNWINLRETDKFPKSFHNLIDAIKTDFEWVQANTQIQVKALEWERSNKESSFLLRGKELQDAELQLATNSSKKPYPTDLQHEYVLKSRQAAERQRRTLYSIAVAGIITLAVLAIIAFVQAGRATTQANVATTAQAEAVTNENAAKNAQATAEADRKLAEERARIARAGELAAESVSQRDSQFDLSLLLSVESFLTADTIQTKKALLDNTQTNPQLLQYLQGHDYSVSSVVFSPDGKTLASASYDGTIILWDVETRQIIGQPITGHGVFVEKLVFSPDGKKLASWSCKNYQVCNGGIIIWNITTRPPLIHLFISAPSKVDDMTFSIGGKILTASSGNTIIQWDIKTGQLIHQQTTDDIFSTSSAFNSDGKTLATSRDDSTIILWDATTGQPIGQPLTGHTNQIESLTFSPDGKTLASGGADRTIILWDVETGQPIGKPLTGHQNWVSSLAFSPDGKKLASASYDGTARLWDVATHQIIGQPLSGHADRHYLYTVTFNPDGRMLATGGGDGNVILWDVVSRQPISQPLTEYIGQVEGVIVSPDGKTRATKNGNAITLWDVKSGNPIGQPLIGHIGAVSSLVFSPDSKTLVSGSVGSCRSSFTPDNCTRGEIIYWNVVSGQPIGQPLTKLTNAVFSLAFSPDGKLLAAGGELTLLLWDVATHQQVGQPLLQDAFIYDVTFSPDGKTLASSDNGAIILWDVATRQPIGQPLRAYNDQIVNMSFSPDGKSLIVKTHNTSTSNFMQWNIDPQWWVTFSCQRVGRNFTRAEWALYFSNEEYRATCSRWLLQPEATSTPISTP